MGGRSSKKEIDSEILPVVSRINADPSFRTLLSCCGHGKYPATIVVLDRRTNCVFEWFTGVELPRYYLNGKVRRRYYVRDAEGFYYLDPSLSE